MHTETCTRGGERRHLSHTKSHRFVSPGDDLYIERSISLVEALCGFEMELTHLDGRKFIIRSAPGEVIRQVAHDPFAEEEVQHWTLFADEDCPDIADVAIAGLLSPDTPPFSIKPHLPTQTRTSILAYRPTPDTHQTHTGPAPDPHQTHTGP